jgi:hypothetical protein
MKMLLILVPSPREGEVLALIEATGVHGYSEVSGVHGAGKSGRHLGTRAFPGSGSVIFTIGPEEETRELAAALGRLAASFEPGEGGLHAFALDTAKVV